MAALDAPVSVKHMQGYNSVEQTIYWDRFIYFS